jgi:hypothetical protein
MLDFSDAVIWIFKPLLDRLADDASFRSGFYSGLLIALAIGFLSRQVLYLWNRVLQSLKPTQKPATNPSPSPFSTCVGAIIALLVLAGILIFALLLAARGT